MWELMPEECAALISAGPRHLPGTNHVRPYSLKHARQQGAILGHLQRLGLLQARGCHLAYRWPSTCCVGQVGCMFADLAAFLEYIVGLPVHNALVHVCWV